MFEEKTQVDELYIAAIVFEILRFYNAKNPKVNLKYPNKLKRIPFKKYVNLSEKRQYIFARIRDNINCGIYSLRDFWNYSIYLCSIGEMGIENVDFDSDLIINFNKTLSDERFEMDKNVFNRLCSKITEYNRDNILDIFYDCSNGIFSIMFQLFKCGSVSARFYRSGYVRYLKMNNSNSSRIGVAEKQFRKYIMFLNY